MSDDVYHSLAYAMENAEVRLETLKRVADKRKDKAMTNDAIDLMILDHVNASLAKHEQPFKKSVMDTDRTELLWAARRLAKLTTPQDTVTPVSNGTDVTVPTITPEVRERCVEVVAREVACADGHNPDVWQMYFHQSAIYVDAVLAELNVRVDASDTSVRSSIEDTMGRE